MTAPLRPTFEGWVRDTREALSLIQGVIDGLFEPTVRRPKDAERPELVRSGMIFVFCEEDAGMKRWTDGVAWSPSRILGNFLIYREKMKDSSGDRRSNPRHRRRRSTMNTPYARPDTLHSPVNDHSDAGGSLNVSATPSDYHHASSNRTSHNEASIYGSLVESYDFKDNGLVKKTFSVRFSDKNYHLISYYRADDIINNRLALPTSRPELREIQVDQEMLQAKQCRTPLDTVDLLHHQEDPGMHYAQMPDMSYLTIRQHESDYAHQRGWRYREHRPFSGGEYDAFASAGFTPRAASRPETWYGQQHFGHPVPLPPGSGPSGPPPPGPPPSGPHSGHPSDHSSSHPSGPPPGPPHHAMKVEYYEPAGPTIPQSGQSPTVPVPLSLDNIDAGFSYTTGPAQHASSQTPRSMQPFGQGQGYARHMGHHTRGSRSNPYNQHPYHGPYQVQTPGQYPPYPDEKQESDDTNDFEF